MKTKRPHRRIGGVALLFGIALSVQGRAQDAAPNRLSAAEKAAGWVLLFDGVDKYAHFHPGPGGTPGSWIIEDQALASAPISPFSDLLTNESYADFELSMEWKLNIRGNSGIFIRVTGNNRQCSGEEFAILDDANAGDRNEMGHMPGETAMPIKRTGANYDMHPTVQDGVIGQAYVHVAKPYDQWNQGTIWANGSRIEHWLNGKKVNDYELGSPDWLQRFKLSKYYGLCPNNRDTWGRHPAGSIGLQNHGTGMRVWFRNIKVRPFTPGGKLPAPTIAPAGGKINGGSKVVLDAAVIGSTLRYTLDGSDPTEASPIYRDSLVLKSAATLKARTYRAGFPASDVAAAVFTANSTGDRPAGPAASEPSWRQMGGRIRFVNPSHRPMTAAFSGVDGKNLAAIAIGPGTHEFALPDLHGLCLMTLRRGSWIRTQKVALP